MAIINGTVGKNNYEFYAEIWETLPTDYISSNTTTVNYAIYLKNHGTRTNSGGWSYNASYDGISVYSSGSNQVVTNDVSSDGGVKKLFEGSFNVGHNAGGDKTITFSASISKSSYTQWDPGTCSLSGAFVLTTIPRASSPTASNTNIESAVRINTNRASSSFAHTITVTFGNFSRTWTNVGDYVDWNTAENASSLYAQIPASTSGYASVSCTTYSGGSNIGTKTTGFYLSTVESLNRPNISVSAIDTNKTLVTGNTIRDITGDTTNKTLIKYISDVRVSLSASAKNSAYITATRATAGNGAYVNGTGNMTVTFNNVDTASFGGIATDSRGYSNSANANSLTLLDYTKLSLNPVNLYRINQTSNSLYVQVNGNYFKGNFNNTANVLTLSYKYKESGTSWTGSETWTTLTPTISQTSNTYSFDGLLGNNFDYTKIYDFVFKVEDLILIQQQELSSTPGVPIMGLFENFIEAFGEVLVYKD